MNLFHLKKWYLDLVTENGDILYIYFIILNAVGINQIQVFAHLTLADGRSIRDSHRERGKYPFSESKIICGPNCLYSSERITQVCLRLPSFSADLKYSSISDSWIPNGDGITIKHKDGFVSWYVPQPTANIEGTIKLDSQELSVHGTGYQDIVELNIPPWRLPFSELLWGRAHFDSCCIVYNQLTLKDRSCFRNILLTNTSICSCGKTTCLDNLPRVIQKEITGTEFAISMDEKDNTTRIGNNEFNLDLIPRSVFENGSIVEGGRIKSILMRKLLTLVSGETIEQKMLSDATLKIGNQILHGVAINERVRWLRREY